MCLHDTVLAQVTQRRRDTGGLDPRALGDLYRRTQLAIDHRPYALSSDIISTL